MGALLPGVFCDDNAAYKETVLTVNTDQTHHVLIVSDAQISADLILLNVFSADHDDDLG